MLVNRDQKSVFLLAQIVLQNNQLSPQSLLNGQSIHFKTAGQPEMLHWAIDYIECYPQDVEDQQLLHHLHLDPAHQWTPDQTKRVSLCFKAFYAKLNQNRLYAIGLKWLNSGGRTLIEHYARTHYSTCRS